MLERARREDYLAPWEPKVSTTEDQYISYADAAYFLRRYWLTIAAATSATLLAAGLYLMTAQPVFTARSQIVIDPRMPGLLRDQTDDPAFLLDSAQVETELAVLQSEELAKTVVKSLNLVDDSEFQPKEPAGIKRIVAAIWPKARSLFYNASEASMAAMAHPSEDMLSKDEMELRSAVAILLSQLDVRRVGNSYAINVFFTSADPAKAARITNEITEAYIADQLSTRARSARQGSEWLEERIEQIRHQMNEANLRVQKFKAKRDYRIISEHSPSGSNFEGEPAGKDANTLEALEVTALTYRRIYESFLQAFAESVQRQSFPVASARTITQATRPLSKSHPKTKLILALALMSGALAGVGIALIRHSMDGAIRSRRQIREALGVQCLGAVPRLSRRGARRSLAIVNEAPLSRFSNGMRRLKTTVSLASKAQGIRSLGVTSSLPGEGKSTIASNLAVLFASAGDRTLLVDADVHNSTLTRFHAPKSSSGLIEVLEGAATIESCISRLGGTLEVLPMASRRPVPNSSDLLGSEKMRDLLRGLAQSYDIVILDLPPMNVLADGLALCPLLDSVLLLAEWEETPLQVLAESAYVLRNARANVLGAVVTKMDPKAIDQEGRRSSAYF